MVEYPDLSKLRVVDLKGLCSQYGLHTTGRKAELQERLQVYFAANPLDENADSEGGSRTVSPTEEPEVNTAPMNVASGSDSSDAEEDAEENVNSAPPSNNEDEPAETYADQVDTFTHNEETEEPKDQVEPITIEDTADEIADEPENNQSSEDENKSVEDVTERAIEGEQMDVDQDDGNVEDKKMEVEQIVDDVVDDVVDITDKDEVEDITDKNDAEDITDKDDDIVEVPITSKEPTDKSEIVAEEKTSRRSRWGTRWTKEAPDVKIGQMITAPIVAPVPVPKTDTEGNKLTKSQRKKLKKKRRKETKKTEIDSGVETGNDSDQKSDKKKSSTEKNLKIDIDYIAEEPELNPATLQFKKVFDAFRAAQFMTDERSSKPGYEGKAGEIDAMADDNSEDEDKAGEATDKISKKKLKKQSRLTVAELKQIVERPDLVEMHDVTSMDPKLLVLLKSSRNTVAVPRHWSYKRKYLSGKRGIEKPPFELPEFIKKTGIMEMREALQQKEQEQSMKTKMRQRVRPKLGKIDIDYQKLHDAFFRYQTKPKMSRHGDIYYEGKEYETRLRELKPGELTDDLRTALGMPLGNNASKVPPPWLIAMQRYGPPPSYPNLKIPGLNAPIPPGCSFGYHAGGWGKPPVDERGRPLYGDVFGVDAEDKFEAEKPSEQLWGEMESESDSSDDDSEEEESEDEGDQDGTGVPTNPAEQATIDNGLVTPSGLTSAPPVETPKPGEIELRKAQPRVDMSNPPPLYQVLSEKQVSVGKGMMGTSHVYDLKKISSGSAAPAGEQRGNEVSLNPEDLELDPAQIAAKYQNQTKSGKEKEDMSDMMSDHLNKTARDRKRKQTAKDSDQKSKKYKDFKF